MMRRLAPLLGLALVLQMDGVVLERQWFSISHYSLVGITASGIHTRPGIAACGPSYDFGTMFLLDNGVRARCEDRGGAITDRHLDLWTPGERLANRLGRYGQWGYVIRGADDGL